MVMGASGTTALETFNTSVACICGYYQREGVLILWHTVSEFMVGGRGGCYAIMEFTESAGLEKLLSRTAESKGSQWRIAFLLGLACVITP